MNAKDYPVEFGYLAQDGYYYGPNGIVGLYHLGNDRYTPTGTSVVIEGFTIGKTGATGMVGGPHIHTQAWVGSPITGHRDPSPYEFKPGKVVGASINTNQAWGKHITIEVNGVNITYAHLSEINVTVGQVIGEKTMSAVNDGDSINHYNAAFGRQPTQAEKDKNRGKEWNNPDPQKRAPLYDDMLRQMTFLRTENERMAKELAGLAKPVQLTNGIYKVG